MLFPNKEQGLGVCFALCLNPLGHLSKDSHLFANFWLSMVVVWKDPITSTELTCRRGHFLFAEDQGLVTIDELILCSIAVIPFALVLRDLNQYWTPL